MVYMKKGIYKAQNPYAEATKGCLNTSALENVEISSPHLNRY